MDIDYIFGKYAKNGLSVVRFWAFGDTSSGDYTYVPAKATVDVNGFFTLDDRYAICRKESKS